jgi:TPR repeat protein
MPRDHQQAVVHYYAAASRGLAAAQRKLALAYADGDGVPGDDAKLMLWLRKAADAGDRQAARLLAYAISIDINGSYDQVEAAMWSAVAEGKDGHDAAPAVVQMRARLSPREYQAFQTRLARWHERANGG